MVNRIQVTEEELDAEAAKWEAQGFYPQRAREIAALELGLPGDVIEPPRSDEQDEE